MAMKVFSDPRCLRHLVPAGFPELPARLEAILAGLERAGFEVEETGEHPATSEAIEAVHDQDYIRRFQRAVDAGEAFIDTGDNPLSPGSWEAARAAVDVCLRTADWVHGDRGRRGVALVRPPGHHAERAMAMGFCYFNNVAVTAEYFRRVLGYRKLAIVDFDVHHGNGTQHLFEERPEMLYLSLHQHPFYPGTGTAAERGRDAGTGATLNLPLAAGSGDEVYSEVFQKIALPALRQFSPETLLISAGFDAWQDDPVGGMRVGLESFETWGRWLGQLADETCDGRVFVTLEGGYDLRALADLTLAHLRGLEG